MPLSSAATALSIDVALDYHLPADATLLLAIEALSDDEQWVDGEELRLNGVALPPVETPPGAPARYRWIQAPAGPLHLHYQADVRVDRPVVDMFPLPFTPLSAIPPHIAPWLFASRYCDPAPFDRVLAGEMNLPVGWVADGSTIIAIRDWICGHLAYQPVSTAQTTAADSYIARAGVCRDFAHLMIALSRAAGVPARFVSAYAWQLDPPDFHAVAEVWMNGQWHLVDATGLAPNHGLVRIARTADAVNASFMTIFGSAQMVAQRVCVRPTTQG
ncbi:MAG: transglutaminase-like domain-containing protein [Sphingopyxis sp.]